MANSVITGLDHVSLLVRDTARALDFYTGILGLAQDETRPDLGYAGAWLQTGNGQIHLIELPSPDPIEGRPAHGGRDRHTALRFRPGYDHRGAGRRRYRLHAEQIRPQGTVLSRFRCERARAGGKKVDA